MNHEEWLKWRNKGLGGSDISALLGLNPYMNNVELWEDKALNKKKVLSKKQEEARQLILNRGHEVEPLIRQLFVIDNPQYIVDYVDNDHLVHPQYDFMRGTIDGRLTEKETGKKGLLEIKHVQIENRQQRDKWKWNEFPYNYYCQVIWYLGLTDLSFAVLKARIKDGDYTIERKYRIEREEVEGDILHLQQTAKDFWQYVVEKKVPPLVLPSI